MSSTTVPNSLYESLLLKLATIMELTQNPEGSVTPQGRQTLLHAVNDFKGALSQAKELAIALPGGELMIEEQDEVIGMLKKLRERKRLQLSQFSSRALSSSAPEETKMEVDSTASTPVS